MGEERHKLGTTGPGSADATDADADATDANADATDDSR